MTNIFKLARVHIPSTDRNQFMHSLLDKGYINAPFRVDDEQRYITFMSDGTDDKEVIIVPDSDFDELAFVYEDWKSQGRNFDRCEKCGRLIKKSKTKPRKYCEECAKYAPVKDKTVECIDCGKVFKVEAHNTRTCRCEECQDINRKGTFSKYNAKRRGKSMV